MLHVDRRTAGKGDHRSEYHEACQGPAFRHVNGAPARFSHEVLHCHADQAHAATERVSSASTMNLWPFARKVGGKISIATATARGVYEGRRPGIDAAEVTRLSEEERLGATAITRCLGIGRASGYRHLGRPRQLSAAAA
jgi:hypothetical protein